VVGGKGGRPSDSEQEKQQKTQNQWKKGGSITTRWGKGGNKGGKEKRVTSICSLKRDQGTGQHLDKRSVICTERKKRTSMGKRLSEGRRETCVLGERRVLKEREGLGLVSLWSNRGEDETVTLLE